MAEGECDALLLWHICPTATMLWWHPPQFSATLLYFMQVIGPATVAHHLLETLILNICDLLAASPPPHTHTHMAALSLSLTRLLSTEDEHVWEEARPLVG